MADETLPTRGICHLVEHLAIEPQPRLYAHNGWCSVDSTGFWAEGDRDEVLDYLSGVARRLHPLPRDRMVAERQILATEGSQRGGSIVTTLLSCRWGARTYGTASYDEFGLFRLSEDEAQAWADRYFVADNAVLFMTGEPPEGFSLELPRGERHSPTRRRVDQRSSASHRHQPWAGRRRRRHGGRPFSRHRAGARLAGVRRHCPATTRAGRHLPRGRRLSAGGP